MIGDYADFYVRNFGRAETALLKANCVGRIIALEDEGLGATELQAIYVVGNVISAAMKFYCPGKRIEYCLVESEAAGPFITRFENDEYLIIVPVHFVRFVHIIAALTASTDVFTREARTSYEPAITLENFQQLPRIPGFGTLHLSVTLKNEEFVKGMTCLFSCMIGVVVFHEVAHFLHGHLSFCARADAGCDDIALPFSWRDEAERLLCLETMEFDADSFAAIAWVHLWAGGIPIPDSFRIFAGNLKRPDWLVLLSAAVVFLLEDINKIRDPTWVDESAIHRHARTRIIVVINTYGAYLRIKLQRPEEEVRELLRDVASDVAKISRYIYNNEISEDYLSDVEKDTEAFGVYADKVSSRWALMYPMLKNLSFRQTGNMPGPTNTPR